MKTPIIVILLILSSIFSANSQQQIPNGNFETWSDDYTLTGWKSYDYGFFGHPITKNTSAFEGDFAVQIKTLNILGTIIPGIISLGNINLSSMMPYGGIPYTDRPQGLSFEMKYNPVQGDTMAFFAYLTKWNSEAGTSDTIGGTFYFSDYITNDYQNISLPFIYQSEEIPDSINIGFLSSAFSPKVNSTLIVDDLQMLNTPIVSTSICLPATNVLSNEFSANWLAVPNATSYLLDVSTDYNFTNILPQYNQYNVGSINSYSVSELSTGIYFYRVSVLYDSEQSIYSNRMPAALPVVAQDAGEINTGGFTAHWTQAENCTAYQIDVARDEAFTQIEPNYSSLEIASSENNLQISGLMQNTTYYYRVRAKYASYISENSNTVSTSTLPTAMVDVKLQKPYKIEVNSNTISIYFDKQNEKYQIEVFDLLGKRIYTNSDVSISQTITLKKSTIYFLKIRNKKLTYSEKICP